MTEEYLPNGVAEFVDSVLPHFGYAVDVGASDGLFLSNSKVLEDKGWIVLCVEPNPDLVEPGRRNRKLWVEAACGRHNQNFNEFTIVGRYPYASVSGFHVDEADPCLFPQGWYGKSVRTVNVRMITLDFLLENSGFPRLDFLTIDTEGHELEVLAGLDLHRWKPQLIVAEAWTEPTRQKITDHLSQFDYSLAKVLEFDACYFLNK